MLELKKKMKKEQKKLEETILISNTQYPSSIREWSNSIYLYTKANLNLIPFASKVAKKLIKGLFNLYNQKIERKLRTKRLLLRLRRVSSNRLFLSEGEFKHRNNNVIIDIYLFNRQIYNYTYKLKNRYLKNLLGKKKEDKKVIDKLKYINDKSVYVVKNLNKSKFDLLNKLNITQKSENYKINIVNGLSSKTIWFYKRLINLTMKKLRLFFLYKQLIYMNRSKLNYNYLYVLKKQLEKIYNKNVEFNLINLNRFYLNSDILFDSVRKKLTRNRRKLLKTLNKVKNKIQVHSKKYSLDYSFHHNTISKKIGNNLTLKDSVFNNLKYKHVTGFRVEVKGRLNKRFTAARSLHKVRYNGNLLNLDSSGIGLSSVILKGNLKPNLQQTNLSSTTRIGTFGVKGWISGY